MLFSEALDQLKALVPMKRQSWDSSHGYLIVLPGFNTVYNVKSLPAINILNYLFILEDFEADDWVCYEAPELSQLLGQED